jgi:GT2 family glycosyltransferase
MSKIIFLIPSYQPTVVSCELLEELRKTDPGPIVVVDDGSGPAYRELFQRASRVPGTTVLTNAINLGKGAALKHGMNHVLVNHPDCVGVVTADADGQHAVSDILKIANELRAHPAEAIFGSRDFKRDVPLRSKIGNTISRYVYPYEKVGNPPWDQISDQTFQLTETSPPSNILGTPCFQTLK